MFFFLGPLVLLLSLTFWPFGPDRTGRPIEPTSLDLPADPSLFREVRISLLQSASEIVVSTSSPYRLLDAEGRSLLTGERILAARVSVRGEGIVFGSQTFRRAPITLESEGEGIRIGKRLYRQSLVFWPGGDGKLDVINELAIEEYLKGVLPWEANPKWTPEALKAQAVAARTFALFQAIKHRDERFHLTKDVASQVYGGKVSEKPETSRAVDATRGEILTYRGKIFSAYFHSTCGGATTRAEKVWPVKPHPSLEGVPCPFCRGSKHYRWVARFPVDILESKLKAHGVAAPAIQAIVAEDRDRAGRAHTFMIVHSGGRTKVPAGEFRLWMDPFRFKSTLLDSIERDEEGFVFRGRGWGHGVGMCQYGMKQLAELGYDYKKILRYYYPDADIIPYS